MEIVTNGVQDLPPGATEAQKREHEENKQTDYKGLFLIQSADLSTFEKIAGAT